MVFSFTRLGYTQRQSLSPPFCVNCQSAVCIPSAATFFLFIVFFFFSHMFNFETYSKKSCWKRTRSGQRSIFVCFVLVDICSLCWVLTVASPFLASSWNISLQLFGLSLLLFFHTTCHSDNGQAVAAAATSQVKLCPYDEENWSSGSASLRRSLLRRASGHRSLGTPMLQQACPIKSFVTFWTQLMSATNQINTLIFWKKFCLGGASSHPGGPAATSWVSFSDPLVSSPSQQEHPRIHPGNCFYPTPGGDFCTPWAGSSFAASTKTIPAAPAETAYEDRPVTSSSILQRPVLRGEPCGGCLCPWFVARPSIATVLRTPALLHTVYSLCI